MAHYNEIVVKTAKNRKNTLKAIKTSLAEVYPDFSVQDIVAEGREWKATLIKELTDEEVVRLAALPVLDSENDEPEEELELEEEGPEEELESSDEDGPEEKNTTKEELKDIESLLLELKEEVRKLQEKADVVDTVHDTVKDHVDMDGMDEIAPKPKGPAGGGNPLGMKAPQAPRPPMPPAGKPVGASKVAYASIRQDGFEFSVAEVAEAMQEKYPGYRIARIDTDVNNNRYIARLERK